jgi:hypothetical protein
MTQMSTPWGTADAEEHIALGITFYETPSHGGFHLDAERNALVPLAWREASFNQQGLYGWFEEDCDAVMVVLSHPTAFSASAVAHAEKAFASMFAPKGLVYAPARVEG